MQLELAGQGYEARNEDEVRRGSPNKEILGAEWNVERVARLSC